MNIAFLIDDNYSEQLSVVLASLLKNDKHNTKFNIYVLDIGISETNKAKIKRLKGNYEINFIPIDEKLFKDFPSINHLKTLNYARILLPSLVECDKILFLDCDILVLDDLSKLYNMDFEDTYACVIKDRTSNEIFTIRQKEILNIKNYFNAGVMLLNLKKIRQDKIESRCIKFILENPDKILFLEQCALNYVFQDNVKFIDKKWNYQYKLNVSKKAKNISIIHFVGWEKPFLGFFHPYENMYFKYLKLTAFKTSFAKFKLKMWNMFYQKFKRRICVFIRCII